MKKPLSSVTAQQFVEAMAALGHNGRAMAKALNRTPSMVTRYMNGTPIPNDVAKCIADLLDERRKLLESMAGKTMASVSSLIVYTNERKKPVLHQNLARFARRQRKPDTRTFPVYRMSAERFKVYLQALATWTTRVRELAMQYTDAARQQDYRLELADLQALAASAPRHAPYDVCIQRNEWDVVSRALRHVGTNESHALRTHWGKYKARGYPRNLSSTTNGVMP